MQALLIFFCYLFFSCAALLFLHLPFSSLFYFVESAAKQNTIQPNQKFPYQPDTDSLLNIIQLI